MSPAPDVEKANALFDVRRRQPGSGFNLICTVPNMCRASKVR